MASDRVVASGMALLELLRNVGEKPGFYIGGPHKGYSIWHLDTLITGYQHGRLGQPTVVGDDILDSMTIWVCTRYRIQSGSMSWASLLWQKCGEDDEAAFKLFFDLLEDYVSDRQNLGAEGIEKRYMQMIERRDQQ